MEKDLIMTRQVMAEGKILTLQYYIITEQTGNCMKRFGIMIRTREGGEAAFVPGVSEDRFVAVELVRKLADGTVTPIGLADVLEDLR